MESAISSRLIMPRDLRARYRVGLISAPREYLGPNIGFSEGHTAKRETFAPSAVVHWK
jgi:hypothetical protein